jgi:hypothetical protein
VTDAVIVGCGARKLEWAAPARELYTGSLFRAASRHAERLGLPWRILSAEHGFISPDTVIEPYDRRIESRNPAPFGPLDCVKRSRMEWRAGDGGGRSWTRTGEVYRTHDHTTPWWWIAARQQAHAWLWAPKYKHRQAPSDCVGTLRFRPVVVELHAGESYLRALEVIVMDLPVVVSAPLQGLTLGKRLAWYSGQEQESARHVDKTRAQGQQVGLFANPAEAEE